MSLTLVSSGFSQSLSPSYSICLLYRKKCLLTNSEDYLYAPDTIGFNFKVIECT